MNKSIKSNELVIDNPKAATFFTELANVAYLEPFVVAETTLSEAAQKLKLSKSRMSYWLKKMLELDLIYTVRVEKRGRHHVSIYRSRADVFIIPVKLVSENPNEDIFDFDTFEHTVKRSLIHFAHSHFRGWHIRYALEQGASTLHVLPQGNTIKELEVTNSWGQIKLTKTRAKVFHQELKNLFDKLMEESQHDKGKKYVFKLVLVEEWPQ